MKIARLLVLFLALYPQAARAELAATWTAHMQANNVGQFCLHLEFDDLQHAPFGIPVNFGDMNSARNLVCLGSSDGVTVTTHCESYPTPTFIAFDLADAAPPTPSAVIGSELPLVTLVTEGITGSIPTTLGTDLGYLFDSTVVWGTPIPAPTLPLCTIPTGTPGTMIANLDGAGALNVYQPQSTGIGNTTVSSSAPHTSWDPGTASYVTRTVPIDVTFADVTGAGQTSFFTSSNLPGALDPNYSTTTGGYTPIFFDVQTTAAFTPPVEVCVGYADANDDGVVDDTSVNEGQLELFHGEGSPLKYERRTSSRDTVSNRICAVVTTLSPFVAAVALDLDGDGVYASDNCPAAANPSQADADADGAGDVCDPCPNDPTKIAPGVCGCNFPDVDSDGDTTLDCVDPCNNVGGHQLTIRPRLKLRRIGSDDTVDDDVLLLRGEFPSGLDFDALDLVATGARILLEAADGSPLVDLQLAGGGGWSAKAGKKFLYANTLNGAKLKLKVLNRAAVAPGQILVVFAGKNGDYPVSAGDEPLQAIIVVGDALIGECAETAFTAAQCAFNGSGNAVTCK